LYFLNFDQIGKLEGVSEEVEKIQWPKVWRDQTGKLEGVSEEVEKIQWPKVWRDQSGKLEGLTPSNLPV
jgi:preprotein translocase subunit SecE